MRDNKMFASLSSGLLARKGSARPAMRPQGFGSGQGQPDDLGWNDLGLDVPAARHGFSVRLPGTLSPEELTVTGPHETLPDSAEVPPVVHQQEEIAREFGPVAAAAPEPEPVIADMPPEAPVQAPSEPVAVAPKAGGRKAAFTLRLDAERHLRLRLACAVEHRSAQQIVIAALDRLLGSLPEVERLAATLPPAGKA